MTKQIARFTAAIMITLLVLVIFWQFRIVVLYLVLSLTLAATLRPLVNRLVGQKILKRAAWILLYLIVLAFFGFFLFSVGETVIFEIQQLTHTVSVQDQWQLPFWLQNNAFIQTQIGRLPPPSKLVEAVAGDKGQLVLPAVLGLTQGIIGLVSGGIVILFLTLYWTINQVHFERLWLSLLPSDRRKRAREIWQIIEPGLGAYIRSQFVFSLLAGIILGLGYWALGSPYPNLLALSGALTCLIPVVGTFLAIIPPLLFGLLTNVQLSIVTVSFTLITLISLNLWVKPRFLISRWDNPILTLIILISMAYTLGVVGIIIAPPLSAVCQILWSLLVSERLVSGAAAQLSDLKERQQRVWEEIRAMEGPPLDLLTSSMERLTQLVEKAEPILQTGLPVTDPQPLHLETSVTPQPITAEEEGLAPKKSRSNKNG